MPDHIYFKLNDGDIVLKLSDPIGPINRWRDESESSCLLLAGGPVREINEPQSLDCHSGGSGNVRVISLLGASWDSAVGDTGQVDIERDLFDGCDPTAWTVSKVE